MSTPCFCICIPTFNRAHLVGNAIESVLGQTFADWRLVVIDNHSTDGTWEILNRKYGNHPKVRLVRNADNIGGLANLNRCLEFAEGDWFGILADDDTYRLHTFETIYRNTNNRPDLLLWTHGQFLQSTNAPSRALPVYKEIKEFSTSDLADLLYKRGNLFGVVSSYFLRADPLKRAGIIFSDGTVTVDVNLYIRFLKKFPGKKAIYWPDLLTCAEVGEATASHAFTQTGTASLDLIEHIGRLADLGWEKSTLLYQLARLIHCSIKFRSQLRANHGEALPLQSARALIKALFRREAPHVNPHA